MLLLTDDEDVPHIVRVVGLQFDVADGQQSVQHHAIVAHVVVHGLHSDQV